MSEELRGVDRELRVEAERAATKYMRERAEKFYDLLYTMAAAMGGRLCEEDTRDELIHLMREVLKGIKGAKANPYVHDFIRNIMLEENGYVFKQMVAAKHDALGTELVKKAREEPRVSCPYLERDIERRTRSIARKAGY